MRQKWDEFLWRGSAILLLLAIPPCLAIDPPAYYNVPSFYREKNFKSEAEGDQFYDLPQLKDFGLTKTPGHHHQDLWTISYAMVVDRSTQQIFIC